MAMVIQRLPLVAQQKDPTWEWDREAEDPTLDVPSHSPPLSMHIKEKDITQL